jgi:hypothetical protein
MTWLVLVAVAAVVVVLAVLARWSSGRTTRPEPPGVDRARREGDVSRDYGPSNIPRDTGGG